jgi:hypothetical protein
MRFNSIIGGYYMENLNISLSQEEINHIYILLSKCENKLISRLIEKGIYNPYNENIESQKDKEINSLLKEFNTNYKILKKFYAEIDKENNRKIKKSL